MTECDECGKQTEKPATIELDPVIKIEGFDYPHTFQVCQKCAQRFIEEEKERECKSYEVTAE